jgi:hypothetical protein
MPSAELYESATISGLSDGENAVAWTRVSPVRYTLPRLTVNGDDHTRAAIDSIKKAFVPQARTDSMIRMLHLEDVLQRLYDSEINVTITMLWDGGFDFAFASYMEFPEIGTPFDNVASRVDPPRKRTIPTSWRSCHNANQLAQAIHNAALEKYPESTYAKMYGRLN